MAPHPGGGGLVILPHKSWNVWNEDNKAKVARDEAANAQLIEAKEKCRKKVIQEVRFERLTGKTVTTEEEEQRIEEALDNINISDWIKDESLSEIAQNINNKMQRERMKGSNKKRKHHDMRISEAEKKYKPRKRHKRNDVSIIEDHYNHKSKFEFDPKQYNTDTNNKQNHAPTKDTSSHTKSSHFSLFNDDKSSKKEEKKERTEYQHQFGKKERIKPWYLMTNPREIKRRMLMKSDEIQRSLPRRLKDYNQNTDDLKQKCIETRHFQSVVRYSISGSRGCERRKKERWKRSRW
eukprot:391453_1